MEPKHFFEDKTMRDEHGVRPKNYELIARLYAKYCELQEKQGKSWTPLSIRFHYDDEHAKVCMETNIDLPKFIALPPIVAKVASKKAKFRR